MNTLLRRVVLAATLLLAGPALAILEDATALPTALNLTTSGPARLQIMWVLTTAGGGSADQIRSDGLVITTPGGARTLLSIPKSIRVDMDPGQTRRLTEVIQLSRGQVRQLTHSRDSTGQPWPWFELRRQFADSSARVGPEVTVRLYPAGAGTGELAVSRLDMRFDDGATVRQIARGESLMATVEITASGGGTLEGVWEVADPSSTSGQPVYRILRRDRQSWLGRTTRQFTSPALPTRQPGLHILQFRILQPEADLPPVRLIYYVQAQAPADTAGPGPITLQEPLADAEISRDTRFAWQPVAGAQTYQLEFLLPGTAEGEPDTPPLAGLLLPATRTETTLSRPVLERLNPGSPLRWRVLAFDEAGRLIGRSLARSARRAANGSTP